MAISLPYTIVNGDPVDAGPVEANYQTIERYTNQEVIQRNGAIAMTAQLKLVGNPVAALDAAPKQYVDQMLPIGIITMFGGALAPVGGVWLLCDGTEYEVAIYPQLAAVVGGVVAGRFRVPNLKDRFPVGGGGAYAHNTSGGTPDAVVVDHAHTIDHTHGANSVTATDTNHYHDSIEHRHSLGGAVVSSDGAHAHVSSAPDSSGFVVTGSSGNVGGAGIQIGGSSYVVQGGTSTSVPETHSHTITGVTDYTRIGSDWIAPASPNISHGHASQTPTFNGASANSGVSGVGQNLPPYTAISFVIRAA